VTDLRREPGVELEYFKATEVQRRGALHLHLPVRFRRPCRVGTRRLRELAMRWGFGHVINLVEFESPPAAASSAPLDVDALDSLKSKSYANACVGLGLQQPM
jgi:hypothetical protein